jgi:hypothetical protein
MGDPLSGYLVWAHIRAGMVRVQVKGVAILGMFRRCGNLTGGVFKSTYPGLSVFIVGDS